MRAGSCSRRALEVFIIENLNPRPVPLAKLGTFCSGDAYLVLHVRCEQVGGWTLSTSY